MYVDYCPDCQMNLDSNTTRGYCPKCGLILSTYISVKKKKIKNKKPKIKMGKTRELCDHLLYVYNCTECGK